MNKRIIIRKAKIEDFKKVHELVMHVHKLHVKERSDIYKDIEPMNFEEYREELLNSNNIYLVAELETEIVGICFAQIKEILNNKIMRNRKILNIGDLCVDEDNQRNGIGKKLYTQIVQLAREKNIDYIELMVWGFNKNAIRFYENLGMNIKNLKFEQKIE